MSRTRRPRRFTTICKACGHEQRHNIQVPIPLVTGQLEQLSDQQLKEQVRDLNHEVMRRGYSLRQWLPRLV